MLYEGSFKEWLAHWEVACRIRTNNTLDYRHEGWFIDHDAFTIKEICDSVSPYLLRRIPAAQLASAKTLYTTLETASQPFRLMDLPADIRLYIYRYVDLDLNISSWSENLRVPPVLASCRQVRQEALPLASIKLSLESEHLDIFDNKNAPDADSDVNPLLYHDVIRFRKLRERLRPWAMKGGHSLVDGIRRLKIEYSQTCDACDLLSFEMELLLIPGKGVVRGCCQGQVCRREAFPSLPWPDCCQNDDFMVDDKLHEIDGVLAEFNLQRCEGGMSGKLIVALIVDALPYWKFLRGGRW
jgi:hypothetical protein